MKSYGEILPRRPHVPGSFDVGFDVPAEVDDEIVQGYRDGCSVDNPWPGANRSAAYRHGFLNGREDYGHIRTNELMSARLDRLYRIACGAHVGPQWWPSIKDKLKGERI